MSVSAGPLSAYMKDDATRQHMIDATTEGLQTVHATQMAFQNVYSGLASVDVQSFLGYDGKVIQKFAPKWRGYSDVFTASLAQIQILAGKGQFAVDTFVNTIVPILKSTSISADDKKQRLNLFTWIMNQNDQNIRDIDTINEVFDGISQDVTSFTAVFDETIAHCHVGNNNIIQLANNDITSLLQKLAVQVNIAKNLKYAGRDAFDHLSVAKEADDVEIADIRNQEIVLAAASYANLAQILETFADGWTTASTANY